MTDLEGILEHFSVFVLAAAVPLFSQRRVLNEPQCAVCNMLPSCLHNSKCLDKAVVDMRADDSKSNLKALAALPEAKGAMQRMLVRCRSVSDSH